MYLSTTAQAWLVIVVSLVSLAALSSGVTGVIVYRVVKGNSSPHTDSNGTKLKMSLVSRLFIALLVTLGLSFLADILNASGMFPNQMNSSYITQAFTFLLGTFTGLIVPDDFKEKIYGTLAKTTDKTGKEI